MTQNVNTAVSRMFTLLESNKCMNRISMQKTTRGEPQRSPSVIDYPALSNLQGAP